MKHLLTISLLSGPLLSTSVLAQSAQVKLTGGHMVVMPATQVQFDSTWQILDGATLTMKWESFLNGELLTIASGGTLAASGTLTLDTTTNSGLILSDAGESLTITGTMNNAGTIRIENQSAFTFYEALINETGGILDMIFSSSNLPSLLSNAGGHTVTTLSLPSSTAFDIGGPFPKFKVLAYAGHSYQLEKNPDLSNAGGWTPVGAPITPTTQQMLTIEDTSTPISTTPNVFYRFAVRD